MLTIGAHMSIAEGIAKAAQNAVKMEANTMQIFSRNPRGSGFRSYSEKETAFKRQGKKIILDRFWPMLHIQ